MAYHIPPPEKAGGHVPRVPHQIAPVIEHEKLFTQNVTNVIFGFETSPNTNPERKKWGNMAYYVPPV